LDLSVFQEAVCAEAEFPFLHHHLPEAVGYVSELSTSEQRDRLGFKRWYRELMELAVFGDAEGPIVIQD
jgi:hypothetical protein